ncbi:MAG TPA: MFS transporter [Longimicrobiales bacterium]|nr:MFS transporter [Longimicrobiales bacterium]
MNRTGLELGDSQAAAPAPPKGRSELLRRNVLSWAFYDFGSSAFNTLMVTFIFNYYFVRVLVGDEQYGTVLWTRAINASAVIVALISPVLGAIADFSARKKLFLVLFALQSILFTTLLFFVGPGAAIPALLLFLIANTGFEAANVFYYAFLPEVAEPRTLGRVSGFGFLVGYMGGLLALAIGLGMVRGWVPETDHLNVRATILLVAGWYFVFSLPMFLFVKEQSVPRTVEGGYIRHGFKRLAETVRHAGHYREAGKLLVARMIYNDGLTTVIAMAAIYAGAVLGMTLEQVLTMAIALNVAAGIGAFGFGYLDDRIGGKKTITISLVLLTVAGVIGVTTTTVSGFWVAATLIGLMMGPNQSASRSLLTRLVPEHKHAEFFGLYAFSGKMSSIFGPLVYGAVVASTANHKLAMSSIIGFFIIGGVILQFVHEREGIALARAAEAQV